jgi:outer membrane receptor for ferrienterochelin and colicins
MPGYGRFIEQQVTTVGIYSQLEYRPTERLTLLTGGRFDHLDIAGRYFTAFAPLNQNRQLQVFVPRLAAMYKLNEAIRVRASYAQGYRGPQAFDEDLHISTVGGDARFIRLSDDLRTERSESYTSSFNYTHTTGTSQINIVAEGFFTRLQNPFILSDQEDLEGGIAVITKRNAEGALVRGVNFEANAAWKRRWVLRSGITFQQGIYDEEEVIWEGEDHDETTTTSVLLRMPRSYGYLTATYTAPNGWSGSISSVYTGAMDVPHVIDPDTEFTVIKSTPEFVELNIRLSYQFSIGDKGRPEVFAGVQNLFNSYQRDFDIGSARDADYVYGPMRPRTLFLGFRYRL